MASQAYVTGLYQELLGRAPDAGGLKHYMGYSNPAEVRSSILGSTEYAARQASLAPAPAPAPAAPAAAPAAAPVSAPAGPSEAELAAQREATQWRAESDKLYGDLGAFDANAKSPIDIYNSALASLGIADARTRVSDLRTSMTNTENLLRAVDPNVSQRTSESIVSEAQRQRLVAMERAPLDEALRTQGQNLEGAREDYGMILTEGKTQADLEYQGQQDKRQALITRMEIARDSAKTAEERRQWEVQIGVERQKMAEETRQFNERLTEDQRQYNTTFAEGQRQYNTTLEYEKAQDAIKNAAAAASAARSSSGGGSSSGSSSAAKVNPSQEFLNYIANQFKAVGGAGAYKATRQQQDAWANSWFDQMGIKDNTARQAYWDLYNKTYNRPANPYDDWLYKK